MLFTVCLVAHNKANQLVDNTIQCSFIRHTTALNSILQVVGVFTCFKNQTKVIHDKQSVMQCNRRCYSTSINGTEIKLPFKVWSKSL